MEVFERIVKNARSNQTVIPGIRVSVHGQLEAEYVSLTYYLGTRGYEINLDAAYGPSKINIDFSIFQENPIIYDLSGFDFIVIWNFNGSVKNLSSRIRINKSNMVIIKDSCIYADAGQDLELFKSEFSIVSLEGCMFIESSDIDRILEMRDKQFETVWKLTEDRDILRELSEVTGLTEKDLNKLARAKTSIFD